VPAPPPEGVLCLPHTRTAAVCNGQPLQVRAMLSLLMEKDPKLVDRALDSLHRALLSEPGRAAMASENVLDRCMAVFDGLISGELGSLSNTATAKRAVGTLLLFSTALSMNPDEARRLARERGFVTLLRLLKRFADANLQGIPPPTFSAVAFPAIRAVQRLMESPGAVLLAGKEGGIQVALAICSAHKRQGSRFDVDPSTQSLEENAAARRAVLIPVLSSLLGWLVGSLTNRRQALSLSAPKTLGRLASFETVGDASATDPMAAPPRPVETVVWSSPRLGSALPPSALPTPLSLDDTESQGTGLPEALPSLSPLCPPPVPLPTAAPPGATGPAVLEQCLRCLCALSVGPKGAASVARWGGGLAALACFSMYPRRPRLHESAAALVHGLAGQPSLRSLLWDLGAYRLLWHSLWRHELSALPEEEAAAAGAMLKRKTMELAVGQVPVEMDDLAATITDIIVPYSSTHGGAKRLAEPAVDSDLHRSLVPKHAAAASRALVAALWRLCEEGSLRRGQEALLASAQKEPGSVPATSALGGSGPGGLNLDSVRLWLVPDAYPWPSPKGPDHIAPVAGTTSSVAGGGSAWGPIPFNFDPSRTVSDALVDHTAVHSVVSGAADSVSAAASKPRVRAPSAPTRARPREKRVRSKSQGRVIKELGDDGLKPLPEDSQSVSSRAAAARKTKRSKAPRGSRPTRGKQAGDIPTFEELSVVKAAREDPKGMFPSAIDDDHNSDSDDSNAQAPSERSDNSRDSPVALELPPEDALGGKGGVRDLPLVSKPRDGQEDVEEEEEADSDNATVATLKEPEDPLESFLWRTSQPARTRQAKVLQTRDDFELPPSGGGADGAGPSLLSRASSLPVTGGAVKHRTSVSPEPMGARSHRQVQSTRAASVSDHKVPSVLEHGSGPMADAPLDVTRSASSNMLETDSSTIGFPHNGSWRTASSSPTKGGPTAFGSVRRTTFSQRADVTPPKDATDAHRPPLSLKRAEGDAFPAHAQEMGAMAFGLSAISETDSFGTVEIEDALSKSSKSSARKRGRKREKALPASGGRASHGQLALAGSDHWRWLPHWWPERQLHKVKQWKNSHKSAAKVLGKAILETDRDMWHSWWPGVAGDTRPPEGGMHRSSSAPLGHLAESSMPWEWLMRLDLLGPIDCSVMDVVVGGEADRSAPPHVWIDPHSGVASARQTVVPVWAVPPALAWLGPPVMQPMIPISSVGRKKLGRQYGLLEMARLAVAAGCLPDALQAEIASLPGGRDALEAALAMGRPLLPLSGTVIFDTHGGKRMPGHRPPFNGAYRDLRTWGDDLKPSQVVLPPPGYASLTEGHMYDLASEDDPTLASRYMPGGDEGRLKDPVIDPERTSEWMPPPRGARWALKQAWRERVLMAADMADKQRPAAALLGDSVSVNPALGESVPPLEFESRFETGNLRAAVRTAPSSYSLVLDPDTNTSGHTQWFWFRVTGMTVPTVRAEGARRARAASRVDAEPVETDWRAAGGVEYTFTIINLEKNNSSFNEGMRPLVFLEGAEGSEVAQAAWVERVKECAKTDPPLIPPQEVPDGCVWPDPFPGSGWRRIGSEIFYCDGSYFKRARRVGTAPTANLEALEPELPTVFETTGTTDVDAAVAAAAAKLTREAERAAAAGNGGGMQDVTLPTGEEPDGMEVQSVLASSMGGATPAASARLPRGGSRPAMVDEGEDEGDVVESASTMGGVSTRAMQPMSIKPAEESAPGLIRLRSESWKVVFPPGTQAAWFCYCFPYSYADLGADMLRWQNRSASCEEWPASKVPIVDGGRDAGRPLTLVRWAGSAALTGPQTLRGGHSRWGGWPSGLPLASPAAVGLAGARMLTSAAPTPRPTKATGKAARAAVVASEPPKPSEPHVSDDPEVVAGERALACIAKGNCPLAGSLWSGGTMHRSILCYSLAGNPVPLLTITDFSDKCLDEGAVPLDRRPVVVLSGRVHPGETNASWLLRGALDFLTSTAPAARALRKWCVFKVIPFLNPDGVVNGHHRTNLAGLDLNRQWASPSREKSPTIWHLKALLLSCARQRRGPLAYVDFHGHSRKRNVFMFGCGSDAGRGAAERLLPRLIARRAFDFSMKGCSFEVAKEKAGAARVATHLSLPLVNAFTIEASFAGASRGPRGYAHFTTNALEDTGRHFMAALCDMLALWRERPVAAWSAGVHSVMYRPVQLRHARLPVHVVTRVRSEQGQAWARQLLQGWMAHWREQRATDDGLWDVAGVGGGGLFESVEETVTVVEARHPLSWIVTALVSQLPISAAPAAALEDSVPASFAAIMSDPASAAKLSRAEFQRRIRRIVSLAPTEGVLSKTASLAQDETRKIAADLPDQFATGLLDVLETLGEDEKRDSKAPRRLGGKDSARSQSLVKQQPPLAKRAKATGKASAPKSERAADAAGAP
jgi:hypothetical protein